MVKVCRTVAEMKGIADHLRGEGLRIGLVPTMGYLHEGHLSLIGRALSESDVAVVSIFVNPIQFGPKEDLAAYPRDIARDLDLIHAAGAQYAFVPEPDEIYPPGFCSYVQVEGLTDSLCGLARPGHFRGVTTVVAKLFHAVKPHVAVFGQKDAQQVLVIERMTRDLDFDVAISVAPTVREPDGLAKSSRNIYLAADERKEAPVVYRALQHGKQLISSGRRNTDGVLSAIRSVIETSPKARIDYIEAVDRDRLTRVSVFSGRTLIAVAVYFGKARLIDNLWVDETPQGLFQFW
ncbi:MAG: pantoate--beta-alanine ligase [bacterium]|nr:pantoate--beta-alanine ligase [bacterium]